MSGVYEPDVENYAHTRRDPRFAEYGAELDSTAPAPASVSVTPHPSRAWRLMHLAFDAHRRGLECLAGRLSEMAVEEARRGRGITEPDGKTRTPYRQTPGEVG